MMLQAGQHGQQHGQRNAPIQELLRNRLNTSERCRLLHRIASRDHLDIWHVQDFRTRKTLELVTSRDPVPPHARTLEQLPEPQRGLLIEAWIGLKLGLDGIPAVKWAGINTADRLVLAREPALHGGLPALLAAGGGKVEPAVLAVAIRLLHQLLRLLTSLHGLGIAHLGLSPEVVRCNEAHQLRLFGFDRAHVDGLEPRAMPFDRAVETDLQGLSHLLEFVAGSDHQELLAKALTLARGRTSLAPDQFLRDLHSALLEAEHRGPAIRSVTPRRPLSQRLAHWFSRFMHADDS